MDEFEKILWKDVFIAWTRRGNGPTYSSDVADKAVHKFRESLRTGCRR